MTDRRADAWPTLGWACYLGSSWTWVIGMILPALLLRDYGLWGFAIFAVPNVLGAAAMGFVLRDADASRRLVEAHRPALNAFSDVTVAYHVFVTVWLGLRLYGEAFVLLIPPIAAVLFLVMLRSRGASIGAAVLVTAVSLGVVSWSLVQSPGALNIGGDPSTLRQVDLLLFVPAAVAGFLCCPYLDLTFHRARQQTSPGGGRLAFALGFGAVFLTMILFAAAYGGALGPYLADDETITGAAPVPLRGEQATVISGTLPVLLWLHLFIQIAFTLSVHTQERLRTGRGKDALGLITAIAVGAALGVLALGPFGGEQVYRGFLLCYGTVFPLYVWLCVIPRRGGRGVCPKRRLAVFAVASVAAYPLAWMGYVWFQPAGAVGAVMVFVLARAVLEALPTHATAGGHESD